MKELKYKCVCGGAFESIEELQFHHMTCVAFRKSIIKLMPKHKKKQAVKVGVRNVSNKALQDGNYTAKGGNIREMSDEAKRRGPKSPPGTSMDESDNQKVEPPKNKKPKLHRN